MHHLLTLENLDHTVITRLLDRAEGFRRDGAPRDLLLGRTVLTLFFEHSTRTRTSFVLAAKRLGADNVNFELSHSSTSKGESLLDTLHTLEAMGLDALVVRHNENGMPKYLAEHAKSNVAIINAGDGTHAHPTQGLLDALTIRQRRPDFENLRVTICGDIRHSRVARSDAQALHALGVGDIRLCAPAAMLPDALAEFPGCSTSGDFDAALAGTDVVIMLRIQKERMAAAQFPDAADYHAHFGLDARRLALAAQDCQVLHPGPINRGIEIAPEIADGPQSRILDQVANGVAVRMAVLADLLTPPA
ncbi:MAG TPA: aspartate carbamoyltransferase catalytic subunit [Rhodanobacteraceae bacterium]|jgi:aspartate carbamoyltransferase catalytic subunit|nr:aspartate carbamoyltransferase catalytic subunit [Rhodanobacteraceae bacterium]